MKYINKYLLFFTSIILILIIVITFNSNIRRIFINYTLNGYKVYKMVSIQTDLKGNYNIIEAKKKIINYIETSEKIAFGKSKLLIGIYDVTKLVESKATTKNDYILLEDVFERIVLLDPSLYEGHLWLAKSYYHNDKVLQAVKELDKSIEISSANDGPYRLALKIFKESGEKKLFNDYCNRYSLSQFGGTQPRYKESFFGGYTINKFGVSFYKNVSTENMKIYTNSGLKLNSFNGYEIVPEFLESVKGLNLYLSFLPGIKLEIKNIEVYSKNEINVLQDKDYFVYSRNSFILNNENMTTIIITKEGDEVITIDFNKDFKNVEKVHLNFQFSKLNLTNSYNCN